ncbi:MAG TPA: membrane dipeptidase [Vicinamibacterales bacterium]|nr:membrane dipeptidase [Vicinamibacterales bacterium]
MRIHRRGFLQAGSAALVGMTLHGGGAAARQLAERQAGLGDPPGDLFDHSLVVDALSVDDTWDDAVWGAFQRSGVTAIQTSLNNRNLALAVRDLAEWQERFDRFPDRLVKVLTGRELADAKRTKRLAVMLGFQNATMLEGQLANLDVLHRLGTRCIQLTYNSRNLLGDGCTERTNAGLSDFGVAVVERMNALGMIVDLSHCGEQTSRDGILVSKRPPAFTHTMCKAIYDHVRAKPDDLIRALAEKGGVIGMATLGYFIGPTAETTFDDYLRHVDHAVKVAGIDHVGLASDYSIRGIEATATRETWYEPRLKIFKPSYRVRWPPWIKELDPPERFRNIADGLARRGYAPAQIEKILGGNWARYFQEVLLERGQTPLQV